MATSVHGIHHVTCIAGNAQENLDFYVALLGMRLVKKSVNQDDPGTYHLFYADRVGNPGTDFTFYLSLLAIAATGVVLWFARKLGNALWAVGLGLLLAGVVGNLTDRLFREPEPLHGHVVDMFMVPNFPVFNVADICINAAAAVIILQTFRGITISGARAEGDR